MKRKLPALLLVLCLFTLGCTSLERSAYNTVVAAKSFLDSEKSQHPECSSVSSVVCTDIGKAVAAKDLLIDAITVYCAGPDFATGGACNAPHKGTAAYDQAAAKLQSAIANYKQLAADLKAVK